MNKLDQDYISLVKDILDNGNIKEDRTGTGTISIFGRQIRHKMSDGFPLLTTKKMPFKTIITELLWFLRGDTNIKYLVDNNCHIWNGDAYKNYENKFNSRPNWGEYSKQDYDTQKIWGKITSIAGIDGGYPWTEKFTQEEFINKIKTDDEFAKKWGITIETKELSREERWDLYSNRFTTMKPHKFQKMLDGVWVESTEEEDMFEYDVFRIPKRAITITYNGQTQEKYE